MFQENIDNFSSSVRVLSLDLSKGNIRKLSVLLTEFYSFLDAISDNEAGLKQQHFMTILGGIFQLFRPMVAENLDEIDTIMEPSLKILHYLLSKTSVKQMQPPKFTGELLVFLGTLIYSDDRRKKVSEEVKQLIVNCISSALPARYKEGRYNSFQISPNYHLVGVIRTESFLPKASQGIKGLIDIIQYEKNVQLRLDALVTLNQYLIDNVNDINLIAVMFPGAVSKLCTTLTQRPEKENHTVVSCILYSLGELVQTLMSDEKNNTLIEIHTFQDIVDTHSISVNQDSTKETKIRSKSWYENTKKSLLPMLSLALKDRSYTDWRKRLAYLDFAYTILSNCTKTLDNCVKLLVNVIVLHRDDAYKEISNKALVYMESLRYYPFFENIIVPVLKDELYECLMKFPKHMITGDEQEKINAMSLISGLILSLENDSKNVLSTALSKSSDGWMTALEIDQDSLCTLEEKMGQKFIEQAGETHQGNPLYPKIRLKYIINDGTLEKLIRMLNIIGKYCDIQNWIQHYLRYLSIDSLESSEPQALFVVYALLSGAFASEDHLKNDELIDDWLELEKEGLGKSDLLKGLSLQVLNNTANMLAVAASASKGSYHQTVTTALSADLKEKDTNYILNVCFGLQLIGLTASNTDINDLHELLINMLYPLLAHLGSLNVYIHTYALITLNTIASYCGLKNAKELAIKNIDYVINMVSQHISILSIHNRVPFVLKALISVSGFESVKYLEDTVQEICDTLDRYHHNDDLSSDLCGVLFEVVQVIEKNTACHVQDLKKTETEQLHTSEIAISDEVKNFIQCGENTEEVCTDRKSMEDIGKYFLNRHERGLNENLTLEQAIKEGGSYNGTSKKNETNSIEKIEEKSEKPLTYEESLVKAIMEKTSNFLTASSPQLRSQILQLLCSGVYILSNQTSVLNIMVHGFWTFVVNRFDDKENYVVYQAARLIETISAISTDFLSKKFTQNIWPQFKSLLRKGANTSVANSESSSYSVYSTYHRTQLCILSSLKNILKYVPIRQPLAKEIMESTQFYYSYDKVHKQLRQSCSCMFDSLYTQQADTVWLYRIASDTEFQDKLKIPMSPLLNKFFLSDCIKPGAYKLEKNTAAFN